MFQRSRYDAVVIGSGPNGLSAGIYLAQQGCSVLILEAAEYAGGGVRSEELTLPGFIHDPCAAILPLTLTSPFFRSLPLEKFGLKWLDSPLPLVHPLDQGKAVLVMRSLDETAAYLGQDGRAYQRLLKPLLDDWENFSQDLLASVPFPPRSGLTFLRFATAALLPATILGKSLFREETGRAVWAGMAGHAMMPLEKVATGAFGILISLTAHAVGWPFPQGGAGALGAALIAYFKSLGGELLTGYPVRSLTDLPEHQVALFDVSPKNFVNIMGENLPASYQSALARYRYGPGVCKVDFALDAPTPWMAEAAHRAATLHLGGTAEEISAAERLVAQGKHPAQPYVLVAQPSLFDPIRAPKGKHTLWAYCHVPNGSRKDVSKEIETQIERFAPGFRRQILAKHVRTAIEMEAYNPNYVGGDINSGVQDLLQQFTRPVLSLNPYRTPIPGVYLCSSATPPGGGVHGMCGVHAARTALRWLNA